MKIKKSIRFDENIISSINEFSKKNGMTFSDVVENSVINNKELQFSSSFSSSSTTNNENEKRSLKKVKSVRFDNKTLNQIISIAAKKNISATEEIRFRVSSSLSMPCFDTLELAELEQIRININQLGRLLNMSIREKLVINDTHIVKLIKLINEMNNVLVNIIKSSQDRLF